MNGPSSRFFTVIAPWLAVLACGIVLGVPVHGSAQTAASEDLKRLTLEELMDIRVTVVNRQPEAVGTAAAAVAVITRDDIRRSGVTTIADALALADGVHVARLNNGSWSISARGFNGLTPNKLLVMVDGRTEFSPLFAGVFWNMLDYVLEDIERIEVIRGPSGTMWGANAVNGVVNIITRSARETRGTYVSVGSGNEDRALVEARYGGGSGRLSYRIYGKYAERDEQKLATGAASEDGTRRGQAGVRLDGARGATEWLFKADGFQSAHDFFDREDGAWTGLGAQARITRRFSPQSSLQVQAYYRREYRNIDRQLTHHLDTGDLDFQHSLTLGARNHFIWGAGARANRDKTYGSEVIRLDPVSRTYPVSSVFAQNEFAVRPGSLFLAAGVKVERNAFSGGDVQPNVRVRWMLPGDQTLWGAVARAVRRPTRFDDDPILMQAGVPIIMGNDGFESEQMTGWDVGYRSRPRPTLSLDVNVFSQIYDRLRSQELPEGGGLPLTIGNTLNGRSSGVELSVGVQPRPWWRSSVGYTYIDTEVTRDPDSRDVSNGTAEANDPHHLFTLRTRLDLPHRLAVDAFLRGVGELPAPAVPGYVELGARLGWTVTPRFELALVGQDLLHGHHPEFGSALARRIEFERSVRGLVTLRLP